MITLSNNYIIMNLLTNFMLIEATDIIAQEHMCPMSYQVCMILISMDHHDYLDLYVVV